MLHRLNGRLASDVTGEEGVVVAGDVSQPRHRVQRGHREQQPSI